MKAKWQYFYGNKILPRSILLGHTIINIKKKKARFEISSFACSLTYSLYLIGTIFITSLLKVKPLLMMQRWADSSLSKTQNLENWECLQGPVWWVFSDAAIYYVFIVFIGIYFKYCSRVVQDKKKHKSIFDFPQKQTV